MSCWNWFLPFCPFGGEQGLDELKSGKDVPFRRRAELHHQQYRGGQQSFGGIVEVGVLAEGGAVCAGQYDGLCDDFCLLLRLSLIAQPPLPQEGIYVAVHELEQVVAMRPGGIAQVDDRDAVPVARATAPLLRTRLPFVSLVRKLIPEAQAYSKHGTVIRPSCPHPPCQL